MEMKTLLSLEKSQGLKFYHRNPAKEWTFFFFFWKTKSHTSFFSKSNTDSSRVVECLAFNNG